MDKPAVNPWAGKSAEDVLEESYHEIRNPVSIAAGYLAILKSANDLSLTTEQVQQYIELALNHALKAQTIVDSVYQYMNEKR
jgi:light-regulated signal transduction histidine kinase (bacteriophytochrome)